MEVLSSTDISREVLSLIEGSRQFLLLISAYFDPWDRLSTEIKRAATRPGLKVLLLLRGGDDQKKHAEKATDLERVGVKVQYLTRLHAKVYISESQAIVTSMNLVKASALDSWEIAIRIDRDKDGEAYAEVVKHAKELLTRSRDETTIAGRAKADAQVDSLASLFTPGNLGAVAKVVEALVGATSSGSGPMKKSKAATRKTSGARKSAAPTGTCIRCGDDIALNPDKPLCGSCYKEWATYGNADYKESYCHACGDEHVTTMAKPLCRACWRAA
ncbi:phospholipase D-like domain-containing protein [Myxococcota bacterium]|jgi:hypothetical protein|nr:phospholipase D-like domain-containing protein [Myxococcota bacterium]MCK6565952.1 phospholipase D-like domain-containing protein [Dehalococcoidia bacterium]